MASALSVEERIQEIERIDGLVELPRDSYKGGSKSPKPAKSVPESTEPFYINPDRVKHDVLNSIRNRQKIRKVPPRREFFEYVFVERSLFVAFARTSHMIVPGFLGLNPRINAECVARLADHLQKGIVAKLRPVVSGVLKFGWRHLTKYDYNLVAAFIRLLDEIARTTFKIPAKGSRKFLVQFYPLENAFLFFHAKPDFIDLLCKAIDSVMTVDAVPEPERKQALSLTELLLLPERERPNLAEFVVTLSMLASRHAARLTDLVAKDASDLVSASEFDCPASVQAEIDAQVASLVKKLEALAAEKEKSDAATRFVPCTENEELDVAPLAALLEGNTESLDLKADAGKLAVMVFHRYMEAFGKTLEGEINTFSLKPIRVMPAQALEYEFGKLSIATTMLEKHGTPLPYSRFRAIKFAVSPPTQFDAEVVAKLNEIATLFRSVAMKISTHVEHLVSARLAAQEAAAESKTIEISPLDETLANQGPESQTVEQLAGMAAKTAFAVAGYLMNTDVLTELQAKRAVKDEVQVTLRTLERLATTEEYAAIRDHFGLLGH